MPELWTNNAHGTLVAGIDASDLTFTLESGEGARFPLPGADDFFFVSIHEPLTPLVREIVRVTGRTADAFTIEERGEQGTTPLVFSAGARVRLCLTAETLESLQALVTEVAEDFVLAGLVVPDDSGSSGSIFWGLACSTVSPSGGAVQALTTTSHLASELRTRRTATTAAAVGWRGTGVNRFTRSSNAGEGGFDIEARFGLGSNTTGDRCFIGLQDNNTAFLLTGGEPTAQTTRHFIGIGFEAVDLAGSNFRMFRNDGAGPVAFADTLLTRDTTSVFSLRLTAARGSTSVRLVLTNLTTGAVYDQVFTTFVPGTRVLMSFDVSVAVAGANIDLLDIFVGGV